MARDIKSRTNVQFKHLIAVSASLVLFSCASMTHGAGTDGNFKPVPNPTEAHAWKLFQQARFQDSINEYKSMLLKDPKSANAHYGLACCYSSMRNRKKALEEYNKAEELNPEHTGVLNDRANLYCAMGQFENAIADNTKAIKLEDWNASNHNDRAGAYVALKKYDLALKDATNAVIRDGNFVNPLYYRGLCFYRKDENKKALAAMREVLDCEPTHDRAHNIIGHIYFGDKQYRKAIDHYTQAMTLDPKDSQYYEFRGAAYEKLGKHSEARRDYKKALELNPKNQDAKDWLENDEFLAQHRNLSDAQLFAVGCCSILDELNDASHETFFPSAPTEKNIARQKRSLAHWWGVQSRADLIDLLNRFDKGEAGHNRVWVDIERAIDSKNPTEVFMLQAKWGMNPATLKNRLIVVSQNKAKLGKKGISGWDFCRYIHLCRWGSLAGYMKEEEAWQRIMPKAKFLQSTFDSWEDLGNNYITGRDFWNINANKEDADGLERTMQFLKNDPNSPWLKVSWQTKLPD